MQRQLNGRVFHNAMMAKTITSVVVSMICAYTVNAQSYDSLVSKAESLYNAKDYKNSIEYYDQAFRVNKKNPNDLYNGACSAALAGEKKKALELLNLAFEIGWTNLRHMENDSDLNSLHSEKYWTLLVEKMQKKLDEIEAGYDKPLRTDLLQILEDDQKYRREIDSVEKNYGFQSQQMKDFWNVINEQDSINLVKVKAILDNHGWVGPDKVGTDANSALFLVIQHSDLSTQEKYLPLMREAVKKGNARASDLALLEDRVALRQGKKQIYGSQIGRLPTGEYFIQPLEDPDNVDKRRAEVGLGKLADYVKLWNIKWNVEEYKKKEYPNLFKEK